MKKFAILMILAVMAVAASAQNVDGGANELMKKVSLQYQKYNTLQFHYTLKTTKDEKTLGVSEGDFYLKGSKLEDIKQVISHPQALEQCEKFIEARKLLKTTFENILKDWSAQFRAKFIRDEFQNNVQYSIVDLTPKTAQSYYRIRVYIGKTSLKIAKVMVYEKDNTIYTYNIEQFKSDIPLDDKLFVFDKTKHPGVEVNDMR